MKDFEKSRIKTLQQERINVQKKTFTKWCNSFLSKFGMEIEDLFKDLEDGKRLIKLLEAISGDKLGKPNQGRMKVHKIENVNKALAYIQLKIKLESIGAEDIVSGNPTLILGLIWTIILRFQIQEIEIEIEDEMSESKEKRSAKEALLLWCQRKTMGYANVKVTDFSNSWRSGMAFNALVHSARPDLLNYNGLDPHDHTYNLNNAFELAQRYLGISKLLDAEDIDVDRPDEKSILTYVSSFYHTFAKMKTEAVGGKRIGKIVGFMMEIDRMQEQYEYQATEMQAWINKKTVELDDYMFPNSLDGIKSLTLRFNKGYMTLEKPPKYKQKSMLDAHFFNINMKLTAHGHAKYAPPEGKSINDLEAAWSRLERAEHERDLALKRELNRLEQLEKMYANFDKKAKLREDWLSDKASILSESSTFLNNTLQIDATFKKHEAIGADIQARAERFNQLDQLARLLIAQDYFFKETIRKRNQQIQNAYAQLLEQFEKRKATLNTFQELQLLFQEMESLKNEMLELENSFQSREYGEYLLAVEDLLAKHTILATQIVGISQRLKSVNRRAQQFLRGNPEQSSTADTSESHLVKEKLDALNKAYELISVLGSDRRKYLEERRELYRFAEECDEEIMWLNEKLQIIKSIEPGNDLSSIQILINKHEQLEDEVKFRAARIEKILGQSSQLINSKRFTPAECGKCLTKSTGLESKLSELREAAAGLRSLLDDLYTSQQFLSDANETAAWCKDKLALVSLNNDCGRDETSAQALLHRHQRTHEQIRAYESEVKRLRDVADVLVGARRFSTYPVEMKQHLMRKQHTTASSIAGSSDNDELDYDTDDSQASEASSSRSNASSRVEEVREMVEELVEKDVVETFVEEVRALCVRVSYSYQNQSFSILRGEVLSLREKSNQDWWLVENAQGVEGFAPANYLKGE